MEAGDDAFSFLGGVSSSEGGAGLGEIAREIAQVCSVDDHHLRTVVETCISSDPSKSPPRMGGRQVVSL